MWIPSTRPLLFLLNEGLVRWHHTAQGTGVSKEFRIFFSFHHRQLQADRVGSLCLRSQRRGIKAEFRLETWRVDGLIYLIGSATLHLESSFSLKLALHIDWQRSTEPLSCWPFFFQERERWRSTVDVLVESREEEPVLQQCNVATDNRNWNDTSSKKPLPCSI